MLSTIITSYNTHEVTAVHVREIMQLVPKPDEIIVVNDAGPPVLRDLLFNLERNTLITYARVCQDILWNYTGARNLGIWLSRGDFLSLEDSDQIPAPNFYPKALMLMKSDPAIVKVQCQSRWKIRCEELNKPMREWKTCGSRGTSVDTGMYRRSAILKAKGFNEEFAGAYGWAAHEMNFKLKQMGKCVGKCGSFYVVVDAICDNFVRRPLNCNHILYKLSKRRVADTEVLSHAKGILNFDYSVEYMAPNV